MTWLRRKWNLLLGKPLVWANVGLAGATVLGLVAIAAPSNEDFHVRSIGLILQLIGIWTVWSDLTATARSFDRPTIVQSSLRWLRALLGLTVAVDDVRASGTNTVSGSVYMKVRKTIRPEDPIENRVAVLEALVAQIDGDLDTVISGLQRRATETRKAIEAEAEKRRLSLETLERKLERAVLGNFSKLAFGVFWLAVGVVIATMAPEIAQRVAAL